MDQDVRTALSDLVGKQSEVLEALSFEDRFRWVKETYGDDVIIALSGSPKNLITVHTARKVGLQADFMNVAVANDENLPRQQYEIEKLRVGLGLDLFTVHAATAQQKDKA